MAQNAARDRSGELSWLVEPIAAGVRYAPAGSAGLRAGVEIVAGPQYGVALNDLSGSSPRSWAAGFAVLHYRAASGLRLNVSPIGAALMVGDDYSAVYPAAQAGMEYGKRRLAVGTLVRVIRVPAANSSVLYWTNWIPVRVSFTPGG